MFLAGLDVGTTGCKISVFHDSGEYAGRVYREYRSVRTKTAQEIDAGSVREGVREVLAEAARKYPGIGGIGITSFGETYVLLNEKDEVLAPSMLYTDPRGEEECKELVEKLGKEYLIRTTGINPHLMYSLPKLMWQKKHLPDLLAQTARICLMEDYIVYLLTGKRQIDYSLATRTMGFDIRNLKWDERIFEAAGMDPKLFSEPVPTGTDAGTIKKELAEELHLSPDCRIISVSHDQVAAAIGSGAFDENTASDGAGTAECITPVFSQYDAAKMADGGYAIVPYIIPGKYVCYAFCAMGGELIRWYIDTLAGHAVSKAQREGKEIHQELEKAWNHTPSGLLLLPHFAGAGTPNMDADSKGAILGLTVSTTQEDLYLACMEGICYEMRLNIAYLKKAGIAFSGLRCSGGGANSRVWLQMRADIFNMPVTALNSKEAGGTGSAMLAGIACGVFRDLPEAAKAMISERETFMPCKETAEKYRTYYEKYTRIYETIKTLF